MRTRTPAMEFKNKFTFDMSRSLNSYWDAVAHIVHSHYYLLEYTLHFLLC